MVVGVALQTAVGASWKIVGDRMMIENAVLRLSVQYDADHLPFTSCVPSSDRAMPVGTPGPPVVGSLRYQSKALDGCDGSSLIMTTGDGFASLKALAIANMPYMLFSPF